MTISTVQIILIFIWSCICGAGSVLDEFQTHRPLIACTVVGLILGDPTKGIILGGTLELIALGWMNIGAAQSPDSALASVISTILVIVGQQGIQEGIAIALPVAAAGQVLTVFARTITVAFQHAADKAAEDANFNKIIALHFSALFVQALRVCRWYDCRCWICDGIKHDGNQIFDAILLLRFCMWRLFRFQFVVIRYYWFDPCHCLCGIGSKVHQTNSRCSICFSSR